MTDKKEGQETIETRLQILKAGIIRFYDEGYYKWKKYDVLAHLKSEKCLNDPIVIKSLRAWEKDGVIKFVGTDECYFQVLKKFERQPRVV